MNASGKMTKILFKRFLCVLSVGLLASTIGSEYLFASPGGIPAPADLQQAVRKVEGMVKDKSGEPLIGVSVVVQGTTNGTVTDIDGKYSLNISGTNPTLIFSYVGYETQTLSANKNVINVTMTETQSELNTVVIVGYGAQKKVNLTGAVSSVDVEETMGSRPITDVGRGLQGAVAGLTVQVPSGEVGSDPKMNIRGQFGSLQGTSTPLILLDNVEIPSIQLVNPDDIESISVLKDAASTSIYGSKGAFGVILINSKKGAKTETLNVTYSGSFAWQSAVTNFDLAGLDAMEYTLLAAKRQNVSPAGGFWRISDESYALAKQWQQKYGSTVKNTDPVVYGRDWYFDGTNKYGIRLYDAQDIMVREWSPSQIHNLSLNGKTGKTSYNIGLGMVDQNGMMKTAKHDDFKRYNASVSLTTEISKYVTVRGGMMYSDRNKRYPSITSTTADPWLYLARWSRLFPIGVQENGKNLWSPTTETENTTTANTQNKYVSMNLGTTINFTKDWDLQVDYTYYNQQDINNKSVNTITAGDTWYTPVAWKDGNDNQIFVDDEGNITTEGGVAAYRFNQTDYRTNPYISRSSRSTDNHVINAYSTYNLKLGDEKAHVFKFMAGINQVAQKWTENYSERNGLFDFDNPQFNFAPGDSQIAKGDSDWSGLLGYFGRVNYMFKDKYLLEANLRYDGTSKFPSDLRWQWFPSFSGGWIISNENFMRPIEKVFSFAKARASWGSIGDQTVSNDLYISNLSYVTSKWLGGTGTAQSYYKTPTAVSPDISWQRIETLDIGFDFRFFRDKLGVSFDWYQRDTKDMIVRADDVPYIYGENAPYGNYGNARTKGWEVTVDFSHRFGNGIGITASATLADAYTDMTKSADFLTPEGNRALSDLSTGSRYGDIYGYKVDRLYQKDDFVYDANGNIQQIYIITNGVSRLTNQLKGNNPNYQTYLESGTFLFGPGDVKFLDLNGDGYIDNGSGTKGDSGDMTVIGNSTPRYQYGLRLGADYKGFDFSIFFQGVGKRDLWGGGQLTTAGYNAKEGAMPQAIAGDFWREDRTDAFYPRPWNYDAGAGTNTFSYGNMVTNDKYLLDMSYLRIKNMTLGYSISPALLKKVYMTKARFYASVENLFTFDNLNGIPVDPEAISGYSMFNETNYNSGRTGVGTPAFKSISLGVQLSF